ncbi:TPA: hypothetical protein ACH3X3_000665 [Trebouxia sp. C0006]
MLDLGVAADLHFANFLLINEQEDLFGENDEDTPAYDNQLVVLQSSKLQFLQLQGPGNGDLLLEVRKVVQTDEAVYEATQDNFVALTANLLWRSWLQ